MKLFDGSIDIVDGSMRLAVVLRCSNCRVGTVISSVNISQINLKLVDAKDDVSSVQMCESRVNHIRLNLCFCIWRHSCQSSLCIRRHSSLQHKTSDIIPRWDSLASQPQASRTASGMLIAMMMMCGRVKPIPMKEKQIKLMTM